MKASYISISQRLTSNIYILSAREAFISLIPYLILTSTLTLISAFLYTFEVEGALISVNMLKVNQAVYSLFPLLTLISLSYFLAKNFNLARVASIALSMICFASVESQILLTDFALQASGQFAFHPTAIVLPFLVAISMHWFTTHNPIIFIQSSSISSHLRHHINLIAPYVITFILVTLGVSAISPVIVDALTPVLDSLTHAGSYVQACVRITFIHLLWFLGIHGDNTYSLLVDSSFLGTEITKNLLIGDLINFFVLTGGSGSGWSLVIAIFLFSRDEHSRHIGKISLPFAIFNINELLIFGLPIVFNPYLLIPFVLTPLLTFSCSLLAASTGFIEFVPHSLSWITPPIINTYLASNGDVATVFFQICMIGLGVMIYAPFVKISHMYNDDREIAETLASKLALDKIVNTEDSYLDKSSVDDTKKFDLNNLIEEILTGDLLLDYEPIVDSKDNMIHEFFAKLRLMRSDGKIIPLDFLHEMNRDNVSNVIYTWMLNRLEHDIAEWKIHHFSPKIHINIERNTLRQSQIIDRIINEYKNSDNQVCIMLREYPDKSNIQESTSLEKFTKNAFEITLTSFAKSSIDTNLLLHHDIDTIEFDREFFKNSTSGISKELLLQLCNLCKKMGYKVKLNGITNEAEALLAEECKAESRQGSYISSAISAQEAYHFCCDWNEKKRHSK